MWKRVLSIYKEEQKFLCLQQRTCSSVGRAPAPNPKVRSSDPGGVFCKAVDSLYLQLVFLTVGTWMLCGNGWSLIWTLSCLAHGCSAGMDGV